MSKFRKKPIVVDAEIISGLIEAAKSNWDLLPDWVKENYEKGKIIFEHKQISIRTDEGLMIGNLGDYLIHGVNGEIYPCKPDIFKKTYDLYKKNR